ncbi:MAG: ribonuclease HI family protein [Chloroflexi bacterium]|nr:ribonuclease HI family protein [Chloroflexota bacterium]
MPSIFFDGGCSPNPGPGYGAIVALDDEDRMLVEKAFRIGDWVSNNVCEYGALLMGIKTAIEMKLRPVTFYGDSKLIVSQVNGSWRCKDSVLECWLARVWKALTELEEYCIVWIPREQNERANSIVQAARARDERGKSIEESQGNIDYRMRGVDYARDAVSGVSYRRR